MSYSLRARADLQKNALQFLNCTNDNDEETGSDNFGRILSNLKYAWLANNSKIVIFNCKNGTRVGSWDFQNTFHDESTEIFEVDEIQRPNGKEPLLVIAVNCDTIGGVICIFDYLGSRIIRLIKINEQISCLHVIDSGIDVFNLSGPLRNFDGVLAVGTLGGNVYIIDLYKQLCDEGFGTLQCGEEVSLHQMKIISPRDMHNIEHHKEKALQAGSHLTIHLNAVFDNATEHFALKEPNGTDRVYVNKQEVLISSLHYCPQLSSILIGFNFGAFQLWNLMDMKLIYTSPICDDHIPITKFAIQEPADDPRAYCYVWTVYSTDSSDSGLLPYLVMYALCYESKEIQESGSVLYENFQYCAVRFHTELSFRDQSVVGIKGGNCLRLESIVQKALNNLDVCVLDGCEEVLSICVIVWKVIYENGPSTIMAIFDLNQWYKEQMPKSGTFHEGNSYMTCIFPSEMTGIEDVYDVTIHRRKIQQFIGVQRMEEHYYPSSLSYDISCLLDNQIQSIHYYGAQKALLSQLQAEGPMCLIRPTEIYQEIFAIGLTPLFIEASRNSPISLNIQREVILNVILEQQMTEWLCRCAAEWENGSFASAGCSLELLISWAFRRGIVLKNNCDVLCVPLFDHSAIPLDSNATNILNSCIRQLKNISFLFSFVVNNCSSSLTDKDLLLEHRRSLQMVEVYFDVLQWLFNVGLLPECSPTSITSFVDEGKIRAPYPADELAEYYKNRRAEFQLKQNQHIFSKSSVLFIDNLIEVECGGDQLSIDWKNDGGDGFYPPRSLQALLRTYLRDGIPVCNKHIVVIYLFLDLAMTLDPDKYSSVTTHLIKFPAVFKVSPSLIKITQAFWQLDHGDISAAMEQLMDPLVNSADLKHWHHKLALRSFLIQDHANAALLYMNIKKPPIVDEEDVLCTVSLLISNNMLDEAFYTAQQYENYVVSIHSSRVIKHLFAECSNQGRLSNIINRKLTQREESIFMNYLKEVDHPQAADLQVTYYMQRCRYVETFKNNPAISGPLNKGLVGRLTSQTRDRIVHNYEQILPTVTFKFIESCVRKDANTVMKKVGRRAPMSVTMQELKDRPEYLHSAAIVKAKETTKPEFGSFKFLENTEEIPFLRTSTVMHTRKRPMVPVIAAKVLREEEKYGPSPRKRLKLSPQASQPSKLSKDSSILETPIVQRKALSDISTVDGISKDITATPSSILKNSSFLSRKEKLCRSNISVRFDISKSTVLSPSSPSSKILEGSPLNLSISPQSSSNAPKESVDDDDSGSDESDKTITSSSVERLSEENTKKTSISEKKSEVFSSNYNGTPKISPKSRRSYKNLLNEQPDLKLSPKLNLTGLSPLKTSPIEQKLEKTDSHRIEPRKPLHGQKLENINTSSLAETSHISIFHTENKSISATADDEKNEIICSKTEYSDVYSMDSSAPEQISEHHSIVKSSNTSKEITINDADSNEGEDDSLSDSFMEYLVEDLRKSRCRERMKQNEVEKETLRETRRSSTERVIAPESPTRRSTRRLSQERTEELPTLRKSRRLSQERSLPEVQDTAMNLSPNRRITRRLSAERVLADESADKEKKEVEVLKFTASTRTRRSSVERSIRSNDSGKDASNLSTEEAVPSESVAEVSKLSPSRRITRRLSAERNITIDSSDSAEKDSKEVEVLKFTARTSRRSSVDRKIPIDHSDKETLKLPEGETSENGSKPSRRSTRRSAERVLPVDSSDSVENKKEVELLKYQVSSRKTYRRSSVERTDCDDKLKRTSGNENMPIVRTENEELHNERDSSVKNQEMSATENATIGNADANSDLEPTIDVEDSDDSLTDSLLELVNNFDNSSKRPKSTGETIPKIEDTSGETSLNAQNIDNEDKDFQQYEMNESENLVENDEILDSNQTSEQIIHDVYDDLNNAQTDSVIYILDDTEMTLETSMESSLDKAMIGESSFNEATYSTSILADVNVNDEEENVFEISDDLSLNTGKTEKTLLNELDISPSTVSDPKIDFSRSEATSSSSATTVIFRDSTKLDEQNPEVEHTPSESHATEDNQDESTISARRTTRSSSRSVEAKLDCSNIKVAEDSIINVEDSKNDIKRDDEVAEVDSSEKEDAKSESSKSGTTSTSSKTTVIFRGKKVENDPPTDENIEKNRVSAIPAKRTTRSRSKLADNDQQKDEETTSSKEQEVPHKTRLSIDPSPPSDVNLTIKLPELKPVAKQTKQTKTYSRKRTRSCDTPALDQNNEASTSKATTVVVKRNLRSASVEPIGSTKESVDENVETASTSGNRRKRKAAPAAKNTNVETQILRRKPSRRQANMGKIPEEDEDVMQQNRIELLDKPNFEGPPDPEEQKIYNKSPTPSVKSDEVSTSDRKKRARSASTTPKESTRRLRSPSVENENVSFVYVKNKRKEEKKSKTVKASPESSSRMTRSRKKSEDSDLSDSASEKSSKSSSSTKKKTNAGRKKALSRLPEIKEESEIEDKPKSSRKRT